MGANPEAPSPHGCHHQGVVGLPRARGVVVGVICAATLGVLAAALVIEQRIFALDHPGYEQSVAEVVPFLVAISSSSTVGAILAIRRPDHPVSWLFLALGGSVALSALLETYAYYGAVARPGSLPAAGLVAAVSDGSFVVWFVLLAWILHLSPTGSPLSRRWRVVAIVTTWAGGLWMLTSIFWPDHFEPPFGSLTGPFPVTDGVAPALRLARSVLGYATALGLLLAGLSLLIRFRRAHGTERRQLLWLAVAVVPLPFFVALAFYASPDHPVLLAVAIAGFVALIPVAAGLSIARYHLYDVERVLSRAVTYLLLSGILAVTFGLVVIVLGRAVGGRLGNPSIAPVLATLGALSVAAPAYRWLQSAVDRRFNRRRHDALRQVRAFVHEPDQGRTVETVLRSALDDASLQVGYWVEDRGQWVSAAGTPVPDAPGKVEVVRHGRPVARVTHDPRAADRELVETAVAEATPELENAMLRAEISVQLAEVRDSRARIAAAHVTERQRLERNLHDGAQQRLLALALELRAAQVNGDPHRLEQTVGAAIGELQAAVLELRELANGLHPAVLEHGGLTAAAEDLAGRFPVRLRLEGVGRRFPPEIEATAWFLACEGVTNAVKHAGAGRIGLSITLANGSLRVTVSDDGPGGADPAGRGLRGLADRAEAVGGTVSVESGHTGTVLIGELPCGS